MLCISGGKNTDFIRYFYYFCKLDNKNISTIKKALKIFWLIFVSITSVIIALALAFQTPMVQTYVADRAIEMLSGKIDGDITFDRIHFKPFTTLVLKNIAITDRNPASDPADPSQPVIDTLFKAKYVIVNLSLKNLTESDCIHLDKVTVKNAEMNLVLEDWPMSSKGNIDNISKIFRIKKKTEKKKSDKELFHIRRAEIKDFTFRLKNYKTDKTPFRGGINWNDLEINRIDLSASELQFKGGVMSGDLNRLSFVEKSGYICHDISGTARVGNGKTIVEDLHLTDPWSDVNLPLYMMSYANIKAFSNYIEEVRMDAEIKESTVDFRTIEYFAPQLAGNRLRIEANTGEFFGTVSDFSIRDMKVASAQGGFSGTLNGRMVGIPEIENARLKAKINDFKVTSKGLSGFVSEWMKEGELDLIRFAPGESFLINAETEGLLNDMDINSDIRYRDGMMSANVNLKNILAENSPIGISGKVDTRDLDIGTVIGTDLIGEASIKADIDGIIGNGDTPSSAAINSFNVDKLHIYGYDYTKIYGEGDVSAEAFDGRITCDDPNLNFIFQGRFGISRKTQNALYRFYAILGHANLNALNIDKRDKSNVSLVTSADFRRTPNGDIYGDITVDNLKLTNSKGTSEVGLINLTSSSRNNTYRMRLSSNFAQGSFTGTAPVTEFIKELSNVTLKKELPALFEDASYEWVGNRYNLDFQFSNMGSVLNFVLPGMFIADNTELSVRINDRGRLNASLNLQRVAFMKQYIKNFTLNINNNDDSFNGTLHSDEIQVASLMIKDNDIRILADNNHVGLGYTYDNKSELENRGEFIVHGDLTRKDDISEFDINLLPSRFFINSNEWKIQPSHLRIDKSGIDVSSVELLSDDQSIRLYGKASDTQVDTLTLDLNRFDISLVNSLLPEDFGIGGAATGNVRITSPLKTKGILVDMICDSTLLAGRPLGELNIGSRWDEDFERFDISVRNQLDGNSSIDARGRYTPKTRSLEATATLDRIHVGYAHPFLNEIFSEMGGYISGDISVDGPLNNLAITSNGTRLEEGMLTIAFTNVPYYADGDFHIDQTGVFFDRINIRDRYTGTGIVSGSINWNNFKDISFDTRIKVNEIEGINLNERQSESFYGNIFGTGNVNITGPISTLTLNVDAVTAKTGELHIPISSSATTGGSNLLKFKEIKEEVYIDPYDIMVSNYEKKETSKNDFLVNLHVNANPDVTAFVEIDKASGHILSGRGNGTIDLEVAEDVFNINGDYTLTGGNYKFVALGFVNREFEIQDGSSVTFNGDILDSSLDIDAIYKTKASLSTLISDTTSVGNRRTVECGIKITDKIANPRLAFSIEIPELDPTIKSRVESALSTEDKVQKQFLSILLSNSFLPDEQSGIFNNSSMLYSNVTEVMAGQLNNILQKLNIPVDLGLNYQPNEKGNDVFDVAVSTQMFNNRVVVNGSVGNKQYNSGSSQTDVVGDLDIEIKLDKSGAFRLNLFSHSADSYTNYLDNSQRNGVGLTYQTEFNSFRQFFKNLFSSKKKRQEAKRLEEEAILEGERVKLTITEDTDNDRKKR